MVDETAVKSDFRMELGQQIFVLACLCVVNVHKKMQFFEKCTEESYKCSCYYYRLSYGYKYLSDDFFSSYG